MTLFRKLRERIAFWRWYVLEFRPVAGGAEAEGEGGEEGGEAEGEEAEGGEAEGEEGAEGEGKPEVDWKAQSRKHERRAKQEAAKLAKAEKKLQEREDADKSEQEKAIDEAKEAGKAEAATEASKARRSDRLEVAVAKRARELADVDDVVINLERQIASGDLDADTIFNDEDKVQTDVLNEAIDSLLESKKHLRVGEEKPQGSADGGKGEGGSKSAEDMSPDEHLAQIRRHKK